MQRKVESHRTIIIEGIALQWDNIREEMEVYRVHYNVTYSQTKPTIEQMWADAENAIRGKLIVLSARLALDVLTPIEHPRYDARSRRSNSYWLDIPERFQFTGEQRIGF